MASKPQAIFIASVAVILLMTISMVSAGEDKGDTIILGAGGFGGGMGGGNGYPNIVSGSKKGDVIIIGQNW
jgi:hypothetical protein